MNHEASVNEDIIPFFQRWLPHPLLTLVLVLLWMALVNEYSHGSLLLAIYLASRYRFTPVTFGRTADDPLAVSSVVVYCDRHLGHPCC